MTPRAQRSTGAPVELADLLAASPLFSVLSPRHQEQVRERFTRHEVRTGAEIMRQGQSGDALYLIESGRVGVYASDVAGNSAQLINVIAAPGFFGSAALLSGTRQAGSFVALEPSVVLRLAAEVFETLVRHVPEFALAVSRELAVQLQALRAESAVSWVDLSSYRFDERLWANVPAAVQGLLSICPLTLEGDVMTVVLADPRDVNALETLTLALPGVKMRMVASSPDEIARFIGEGTGRAMRRQSSTTIPTRSSLPSISFIGYEEPSQAHEKGRARLSAAPTPAVSLVDEIVATGLVHGASDIHIEHEREGLVVRYRIDGILRRRRDRVAADLARPIVSRLKLLARLDITETRKPQDGRISVRLDNGRMVDLRVSTLPAKFGEKVAMRILDSEAAIRDLRTLFPVERVRHVFSQLISRRTGLVLVSGPTGSGKSTTLYSAVHARRSDDLNIMTVEDPIEYHIDGVTQVEVHAETGTGFAQVLRALLRQDPNIILVGEMRDSETARIAVEASLTGHLVMSSIHTNGALEAVARMMDMGVEPFAMANGLVGVMHQRLVKRVCSECTQPFEYPEMVVDQLIRQGVLPDNQTVPLVRGTGCERCHGSGMLGRVAVHAVLLVNDEVREAISSGGDLRALRIAASSGAHLDLKRYAGALLRAGLTVPSEVLPLLQLMEA